MIRNLIAAAILGMTTGFVVFSNAGFAYAAWVDNHCNNAGPITYSGITRDAAISYAVTADGDGYEWGGGCWNSNGTDNTPGAPDSGGEGADCSGFTFKTWRLPLDMSAPTQTYRWWGQLTDQHGPYTAASFKAGVGIPDQKPKTYASTHKMDAFASSSHIGMVYSEGSDGYDRMIEAKGDSAGTGIWRRDYRSDSSYNGVGRGGWG